MLDTTPEIKLTAYNPIFKRLRTDKGWRLELDLSENEKSEFKKLLDIPDEILLEVSIRPKITKE